MRAIERAELFEFWTSNVKTVKLKTLLEHAAIIFGNDLDHIKFKLHLTKIFHEFDLRWTKSRRYKSRFMTNNASWLQGTIKGDDYKIDVAPLSTTPSGRAIKPLLPKNKAKKD